MAYGEILMAGIILLTVAIMPVMVPAAWRLMAAVWLAVFQVYTLPVHGFYPSLAFLCSIGLWPELIKRGRELLRWRITHYYFLLMAVQVISLAWSPDIGQGVRLIALMIPFAFILAATIEVVERRQNTIRPLAYGVLAGAVVEAALVIGFHRMPDWERWFISSSIAPIFINPNTLSQMEVKRWSAFLVNPNTAAAYLGITSLFAQAIAWRYRQWWMMLVGLFLGLGVIFTDSKAGLLLLTICYGTLLFIFIWPKLRGWAKSCLIVGLILGGLLLIQHLDTIAPALGDSWSDRVLLWNFGRISFPDHPLRGLGFGGWEIAIKEYVKQTGYPRIAPPPHNTIIALWSQSGLIAALLGVLFIVETLVFIWRSRNTPRWRGFMTCATLAMAWYFIHQQADNWGLVNERHIMPIAAMLIGIVYVLSHPSAPQGHDDA